MIQSQALSILKTGANVFLTGEPGSGKTHTINEYIKHLRSQGIEPAITASTGIAATHIGGMTIHSWSGIGIKSKLDKRDLKLISSNKYVNERVNRAKILIIEEVSMLLAETLDMVDAVCREIKQFPLPFGGMQVIFVGDFFQLPPVLKNEIELKEQVDLIEERRAIFAFDSPSWVEANPTVCYLTEQYRQDDDSFLKLLTAIRKDNFREDHLEYLNTRKIKQEEIPENIPKLFSRNVSVDNTNNRILSKITSKEKIFNMTSFGTNALVDMLKNGCLSPENLSLKVGASVMFTKNSSKGGFVNGTLGTVSGFNSESGYPLVKIRNGRIIEVEPMDWTIEENEKVLAQITQIPLRLAWAITVHKSQGMSLDEAVMDLSDVFEFGQGYVALSRVRRLSGLYILGWNRRAFEVHPEVLVKDGEFRTSSEKYELLVSKMSLDEKQRMQDNFVLKNGGKNNIKKSRSHKVNNSNTGIFEELRKKYPKAYMPWDKSEDKQLRELFYKGIPTHKLAITFGRKKGAILSRLNKLELLNDY